LLCLFAGFGAMDAPYARCASQLAFVLALQAGSGFRRRLVDVEAAVACSVLGDVGVAVVAWTDDVSVQVQSYPWLRSEWATVVAVAVLVFFQSLKKHGFVGFAVC
jgi:hypothetical protein